jgi:hypothetical protein
MYLAFELSRVSALDVLPVVLVEGSEPIKNVQVLI